jgi:hypothetical protein
MSNPIKRPAGNRQAWKSALQRSAEKALRMKRDSGPKTNIPDHQTLHKGGVHGAQFRTSDAGVRKEPTHAADLKRSHNARSGDL